MKKDFFVILFSLLLGYSTLRCESLIIGIENINNDCQQMNTEVKVDDSEVGVHKFKHITSSGTEYYSSDEGRTWYQSNVIRYSHSNINNYRHISSTGIVKVSNDAGKSWKTLSNYTISDTNNIKVIVANNKIRIIMKNADEIISAASIYSNDGALMVNNVLNSHYAINKDELTVGISELPLGVYYIIVSLKDNSNAIVKFINS